MLKLVDITRVYNYDSANHIATNTFQIAVPWKAVLLVYLLAPTFVNGLRSPATIPATVTPLRSVPNEEPERITDDGL